MAEHLTPLDAGFLGVEDSDHNVSMATAGSRRPSSVNLPTAYRCVASGDSHSAAGA